MLYHIALPRDWDRSTQTGDYIHESLAKEGFIHMCEQNQMSGVLQRYFMGEHELIVLYIDPDKLKPVLRYELSPSVNEYFPHCYGPINQDAIVNKKFINNFTL